jgi:CheY-like chemotaxis protein
MQKIKILWADDEIDLLKPHILFLEHKGYEVVAVTNGVDAIETCREQHFDLVFLDEHMPGISGLVALTKIKEEQPEIPVVMITKNEEEYIMDEAIGSKIADYLIKPVNPNQILLSIKKLIDNKRLVTEKTTQGYQQDFRNIGMAFQDKMGFTEWCNLYRKLVFWELELSQTTDNTMADVFDMQKAEANHNFCKYISDNYFDFMQGKGEDLPILSHNLMSKKVFPLITGERPVFFVLIDNLRFDQWRVLQPVLNEYFRVEADELYMSILPTTTHYCRNAIFAGMYPSEIEKRMPKFWSNDEDEGGKNMHEEDFLKDLFSRSRIDAKFSYTKVTNLDGAKNLVENISNMFQNKFNVIVYNFVDALSHARTDMHVIRELAEDEKAYRSVTLAWFENSPLFETLKKIASKDVTVVITTDHGSIRVHEPVKIVGDRNTNTNLRYKQGKNLSYEKKEVFEVKDPAKVFLPRQHVSSGFVFARNNDFFAYPNNYNYYVNHYKNTFQHGGISMEEMLIPFAVLHSK